MLAKVSYMYLLQNRYNASTLLEKRHTASSNSPPKPGKVQTLHLLGTDDGQMRFGCLRGRGIVEASN